METDFKFTVGQVVYAFINNKIIEYKVTRLPIWAPGEWVFLLEATGDVEEYLKHVRDVGTYLYATREECVEAARGALKAAIKINKDSIKELQEKIAEDKKILASLNRQQGETND